MTSRSKTLEDSLRELLATVPDVMGASVITMDGVTLASVYQLESSPSIVAYIAVILLGAAEQISNAVLFESKAQVCVVSTIGTLILSASGTNAVLAVLTPRGSHLDSIVGNLEHLARTLGDRITPPRSTASRASLSTHSIRRVGAVPWNTR